MVGQHIDSPCSMCLAQSLCSGCSALIQLGHMIRVECLRSRAERFWQSVHGSLLRTIKEYTEMVSYEIFQTTKDSLSRCPESFLARLVNGGLPSEKDESGAYLLDSDPAYFRIILNYLRRGILNLDDSKLTMKVQTVLWKARSRASGLCCESCGHCIETVTLHSASYKIGIVAHIELNEKHTVLLQALREKYPECWKRWNGRYNLWSVMYDKVECEHIEINKRNKQEVRWILHEFGFVLKSHECSYDCALVDGGMVMEECLRFETVSK